MQKVSNQLNSFKSADNSAVLQPNLVTFKHYKKEEFTKSQLVIVWTAANSNSLNLNCLIKALADYLLESKLLTI